MTELISNPTKVQNHSFIKSVFLGDILVLKTMNTIFFPKAAPIWY